MFPNMLTTFNKAHTVHIQELHYAGLISSTQLSLIEDSLAHIIDISTARTTIASVRSANSFSQQLKGADWFSAYGGYIMSKRDHLGLHLDVRLARATINVPLFLRFLVNSRTFAKRYLSDHLQTSRQSDLSIQVYETPIHHPNRMVSIGAIFAILSAGCAGVLISLFVRRKTPHFIDNSTKEFSRNFKF